MSAAEDILNALADLVADRVAERLKVGQAPKVYTQDHPPPGMKKRTFLEHCYRGTWPNRKAGRLRVVTAEDYETWRNSRPLRAAREPEPVEIIADEDEYVRKGGR